MGATTEYRATFKTYGSTGLFGSALFEILWSERVFKIKDQLSCIKVHYATVLTKISWQWIFS